MQILVICTVVIEYSEMAVNIAAKFGCCLYSPDLLPIIPPIQFFWKCEWFMESITHYCIRVMHAERRV